MWLNYSHYYLQILDLWLTGCVNRLRRVRGGSFGSYENKGKAYVRLYRAWQQTLHANILGSLTVNHVNCAFKLKAEYRNWQITTLFRNNLDTLIIVQKYVNTKITLFHIIIKTYILSLNKKTLLRCPIPLIISFYFKKILTV